MHAELIVQLIAMLIMAFVLVAGAISFALWLRERSRKRSPWIEIHMTGDISADEVARKVQRVLAEHQAMHGKQVRR